MQILLTNDDGIHAHGLRELYTALCAKNHQVQVVAPATEQSVMSSAFTLHAPLRAHKVKDHDFVGYAVTGTPVDCVKLGLSSLCSVRPDLVISGINTDANVGVDVRYSGTVGAAYEAAFMGFAALAVSCRSLGETVPDKYLSIILELVEQVDWHSSKPYPLLNLNFPAWSANALRGLRVCPLSDVSWRNRYEERQDPRGRSYWWCSDIMPSGVAEQTDCQLLKEKYATLTALSIDCTDRHMNAKLKNLEQLIRTQ